MYLLEPMCQRKTFVCMLCILMNKLFISIQNINMKIFNKDLFDLINKRAHKKPAVVYPEIKLIKQQKFIMQKKM